MICSAMLITACGTQSSPSATPSPSIEATATPELTPTPSPEANSVVLSDYCIIYPEPTLISGYLYQTLARDLSFSIRSNLGIGVEPYEDIIDEANGYYEEKYEILIGNTNRDESAEVIATADLRKYDYIIKFVNDKIVIYAETEDGYRLAFDEFCNICNENNVASGDNCYEVLSSIDLLSRYGKYDSFAINGVSIENFKLVSTLDEEKNNAILKDLFEAAGYEITLGDRNTPTDYEIIIGDVNRPEVSEIKTTLRDLDWTVTVKDNKIIVLGGSDSVFDEAVETYINDFINNINAKDVNLTNENSTMFKHTYPMTSITLLGSDISEYVILASKSNDTAARAIREHINNLLGVKLEIVTSGNPEKAIILGNARTQQFLELSAMMDDSEYLVKTVGTKIYLGTLNDYHGDGPAVYKFFEEYIGYDIRNNKLKAQTVEVTDIEICGNIDYYLTKVATDEFLAELDEEANERREAILNSKTDITYSGTAYYVSNEGSDENDGLTPETAWATLERVTNAAELKNGDAVFFRRGDIFRGRLSALEGVTYSAYGEGEKPRIYGSPFDGSKHGTWEEVAPNIYKYSERFDRDVGLVSMNNSQYVALKTLKVYTDPKNTTNYVTGEPFKTFNDMKEDMTFWHDLGQASNQATNSTGWLYLCSTEGNPAERFYNIEFNTFGNIIGCEDDVTFDNLCVMYGGCHGIGATTGTTVQNCVVAWIGGSIQNYNDNGVPTRYGNGIEAWGSVDRYTVKDCYIYQCYDAGITHQGYGGIMQNINYFGNLLEYNIYNIEYFLGFPDNPNMESYLDGVYITDNIMRYAGYGWGMQRPDNYAGNLQGWNHWNYKPEGAEFIVKDNIILGSAFHLVAAGTWSDDSNITFVDNVFIQFERVDQTEAPNATMWDKADPDYWAHEKSFGFCGTNDTYNPFDYNSFDNADFRNNEFYIVYNK